MDVEKETCLLESNVKDTDSKDQKLEIKFVDFLNSVSEMIETENNQVEVRVKEDDNSVILVSRENELEHHLSDVQSNTIEDQTDTKDDDELCSKNIVIECDEVTCSQDVWILAAASRHLENVKQVGKTLRGYIDGKDKLDTFLCEYRLASGIGFSTRDSHSWCKKKEMVSSTYDKCKLLWSKTSGVMPVPCFNIPFIVHGYMIKECVYGEKPTQKNHLKEEENFVIEPNDLSYNSPMLPRPRVRISKKIGCSASIKMKEITVFPEFKADPSSVTSAKGLRKLRAKQLNKLRSKLCDPSQIAMITRFLVEVPLSSSHSHNGHDLVTPIHRVYPAVIKKVAELVNEGYTELTIIKEQLASYVHNELFKDSVIVPDVTDRSFYPSDRDIKNHIKNAIKKQQAVGDRHRLLLNELQTIANGVCQCKDTSKLDDILNKLKSIRNCLDVTDKLIESDPIPANEAADHMLAVYDHQTSLNNVDTGNNEVAHTEYEENCCQDIELLTAVNATANHSEIQSNTELLVHDRALLHQPQDQHSTELSIEEQVILIQADFHQENNGISIVENVIEEANHTESIDSELLIAEKMLVDQTESCDTNQLFTSERVMEEHAAD